MKNILISLRSPVLLSALLVLPFIILELVNRRQFNEDFPFPLFGFMWLLPMIFFLALMPIVRDVRAGKGLMVNPIRPVLSVALMVLVAWQWGGLVLDQMPCFLGVPNCD